MHDSFEQVRTALGKARRVVIFVGEELGAEKHLAPATEAEKQEDSVVNYPPEELATVDTFRRDPIRLWRWYLWRRDRIARTPRRTWPESLTTLCNQVDRVTLITENVDALHARVPATEQIELHGSIWRTRCTHCGRVRDDVRTVIAELPPVCDHCGGLVRPDIVLFGESLDAGIMERALRAACAADVFLALGTGSSIEPAASLAGFAREDGALVVGIDRDATLFSSLATTQLLGPVDYLLDALVHGHPVAVTE
ncbi:MAG: hypothetical protein KC620_15920 [Myxococcales bacterium]|nr:hypothetical protein [Myxococcales bacterium]